MGIDWDDWEDDELEYDWDYCPTCDDSCEVDCSCCDGRGCAECDFTGDESCPECC